MEWRDVREVVKKWSGQDPQQEDRSSKLAAHERRPHGETNASLSGLEEDRYPDR
jgi:hypothetical protein